MGVVEVESSLDLLVDEGSRGKGERCLLYRRLVQRSTAAYDNRTSFPARAAGASCSTGALTLRQPYYLELGQSQSGTAGNRLRHIITLVSRW